MRKPKESSTPTFGRLKKTKKCGLPCKPASNF